jgi:hypothetical protein
MKTIVLIMFMLTASAVVSAQQDTLRIVWFDCMFLALIDPISFGEQVFFF